MLSIIIRTKNEEEYLDKTLLALFQQARNDYEIIIVDSGSTDGTIAIAQKHSVHIHKIPENLYTPGYSLNFGFKKAVGEVLISLSAHAIPADNLWLTNLVTALDAPNVAATSSRQLPHSRQKLEPYLILWQWLYRKNIRTHLVNRFLFSNVSSAINADLWRRYPFDESVLTCEDHRWAKQMIGLGYEVLYQPSSIVYHSHKFPWNVMARRRWHELEAQIRISVTNN